MSRTNRKTSKGRAGPNVVRAVGAAAASGTRRRVVLVLGAVAVALGVVWYWTRPTPGRLYHQAREAFPEDPARADALLAESIELAGGDYPAAQILRCRTLGRMGRWIDALGCLGTIRDPTSVPPDDLVKLGREAEAAGQVLLCRMAFLVLAGGESRHRSEALQRLAVIDYETGQVIQALKHARQLQQADSEDPIGWYIEGRIQHESLAFKEAEAAYRQAAQRCQAPELCRTIREELTDVLLELGELAEARKQLDSLEELGLSNAGRVLQARLDRLEGRTEDAIAAVQALRGEDINLEEVLMLSGRLHFDQGQPELAAEDFEQVVRLDPYHQQAHAQLATAYELLGDAVQAEHHAARSRELDEATRRILELQREIEKRGERPELVEELAALYKTIGKDDLARLIEAEVLQR